MIHHFEYQLFVYYLRVDHYCNFDIIPGSYLSMSDKLMPPYVGEEFIVLGFFDFTPNVKLNLPLVLTIIVLVCEIQFVA